MGARGYGKSDILVLLALTIMIYFNREILILVCTRTQERSIELVSTIGHFLRVLGVSGSYAQKTLRTKENIGEIGFRKAQPTLKTQTLLKTIKGNHVDIVVMDDPLDPNDEYSDAIKRRARKIFNEMDNLRIPKKPLKLIAIGQYVAEDDMYIELEKGSPQNGVKVLTAWHGTIPQLDRDKEDYLKTHVLRDWGMNYEGIFYPQDDTIFANLNFLNDFMQSPATFSLASIDIAFGGGDFTAISIAYPIANGICVLGFAFKQGIYEILPEIAKIFLNFKVSHLCYEKNNDHSWTIEKQLRPITPNISISRMTQRLNKDLKIGQFISQHKEKLNFFRYPFFSKEQDEYRKQFIEYPLGTHDDAPDSLANLFFKFPRFF